MGGVERALESKGKGARSWGACDTQGRVAGVRARGHMLREGPQGEAPHKGSRRHMEEKAGEGTDVR